MSREEILEEAWAFLESLADPRRMYEPSRNIYLATMAQVAKTRGRLKGADQERDRELAKKLKGYL